MKCNACSNLLTKPWQKKYCSRRCAITINRKFLQKRKLLPNKFCQCGQRKEGRAKVCLGCIQDKKARRTLKDVILKGYRGAQRWVVVRQEAKWLMERLGVEQKCEECGWNLHVEVIHVNSISSFPLDTLLTVVNARENLRYMCPNCHWTHDNIRLGCESP